MGKKKTDAVKKGAGKAMNTRSVKPEPATSVPDILTIDQAAEYLQLSRATIYRLINESDIPVKRIGERYRFSRRKLLGWVENPKE